MKSMSTMTDQECRQELYDLLRRLEDYVEEIEGESYDYDADRKFFEGKLGYAYEWPMR